MSSRQLGNRQMNFLARLYERGTGDSIPVTVSFQDDYVLIYMEENGNEPIGVPLDEWEVKVGGSSEDKIVLTAHQTGDTLICGDEFFLTAIAEATNNTEILKQISRAKKRNATRVVRQGTGIVAVLIVLTMFGGCVTMAFLDATQHKSRHSRLDRPSQSQEESTEEDSEEPAAQNVQEEPDVSNEDFDGARYMSAIQGKIKRAWHPPAGSKPTQVVVHFTIDKSGKTSNAKIAKSSGDKACDASALKAIKDVSPLPKLGNGSPPSVSIEYTFDLNSKTKKAKAPAQSQTSEDEDQVKRYD